MLKNNLTILMLLFISTVFGQEKNTKLGVFGALGYGKYFDKVIFDFDSNSEFNSSPAVGGIVGISISKMNVASIKYNLSLQSKGSNCTLNDKKYNTSLKLLNNEIGIVYNNEKLGFSISNGAYISFILDARQKEKKLEEELGKLVYINSFDLGYWAEIEKILHRNKSNTNDLSIFVRFDKSFVFFTKENFYSSIHVGLKYNFLQ